MIVTTDLIRQLEPTAEILCSDRDFACVDLVDYTEKAPTDPNCSALWFASKVATPEQESWYGVRFNRNSKAIEIREKFPRWIILTDDIDLRQTLATRCIYIPNLDSFVEALQRHVVTESEVKVVGVTGSVGKTTCVALIEEVLSNYQKTLRLYAKRITPLSLAEMLVNRLDRSHAFITMEYAMYFRWHVAELTRLLPPTVGVMLNVETSHLGIDGINDGQAILDSKRALLDNAQYRLAEETIRARYPAAFSETHIYSWRDFTDGSHALKPFFCSRLSYNQIAAAILAKQFLIGPPTSEDIETINAFVPKERRLVRLDCHRHSLFFDGEVTTGARLHALCDTTYPLQAVVVHEVEFYDQPLEPQRRQIVAAFAKCERVYISKSLNDRFMSFIVECVPDGTWLTFYDNVVPDIPDEFTVVVHWGAYMRNHPTLDTAIATF